MPASRGEPISTRFCTLVTTSTSIRTRDMVMALRSGAFRRPTRRWSRCRITANGTPSTSPIPTRRKCIASIRSSSPGTITSSPTTHGRAVRRITIPTRAKATGRFARPRPNRRITSGCRFVRTRRRSSRGSTARFDLVTSPRCTCSIRGSSAATSRCRATILRRSNWPAASC